MSKYSFTVRSDWAKSVCLLPTVWCSALSARRCQRHLRLLLLLPLLAVLVTVGLPGGRHSGQGAVAITATGGQPVPAVPAAPSAVLAAPSAVPAAPSAVPAAPSAVPAAPSAVPAAPSAAPAGAPATVIQTESQPARAGQEPSLSHQRLSSGASVNVKIPTHRRQGAEEETHRKVAEELNHAEVQEGKDHHQLLKRNDHTLVLQTKDRSRITNGNHYPQMPEEDHQLILGEEKASSSTASSVSEVGDAETNRHLIEMERRGYSSSRCKTLDPLRINPLKWTQMQPYFEPLGESPTSP